MPAKMTVLNVTAHRSGVRRTGNLTQNGGHEFDVNLTIQVTPRKFGKLTREAVDRPALQWRERIEWFDYDPLARRWNLRHVESMDWYRRHPDSATFHPWRRYAFSLAAHRSLRPPPPAPLAACFGNDDAARDWIAANGHRWDLKITDRPSMGVQGGVGGGGQPSLVTGPTRRRVTYFDIGVEGCAQRVKAVQVLETQNAALTIRHFIIGDGQKAMVDDPVNLALWRQLLSSGID